MKKRNPEAPVNDNLEAANDNQPSYHCVDMGWRRRHHKSQKQLLRDALGIVAAHAPADDPEAQAFIAAVRDLYASRAQDHAS